MDSNTGIRVSLEELTQLHYDAKGITASCRSKLFTQQAGNELSHRRGRGMDFEEVRHYQPGDDIRSIDWRVTARTGKPHTKVFREEKERPILLIVDLSASQFFATQGSFKSVIAAKTAAFLAWVGCYHGDRIGGVIFSGDEFQEFRPTARKLGVLPMLKTLSTMTQKLPDNVDNHLEKALRYTRTVAKPGSLVCLISDFLTLCDTTKQHVGCLAQHCDLLHCWITDPIEFSPPPANRYTIHHDKTTGILDTRSNAFCQHYQTIFKQHHENLQNMATQYRTPLIQLSTNSSTIQTLQQFLVTPR